MALTDHQLITSTDSGALSRVVLKLAADGELATLNALLAALRTAGIIAQ